MGRPLKDDWHRVLEKMIREAHQTLRWLPANGIKPAGYKSNMPTPTPDRDYWDRDTGYNSIAARRDTLKPVRFVTSAAISRLDVVLTAIAGADINQAQRDLVWDRAKGLRWKQIQFIRGLNERTARRLHSGAIAEICLYIIAKKRFGLSVNTLSKFKRFAA